VISYGDLFTANKQLLDMKLAEYWSLVGVIEANDIPDLFELVENSSCIVNKGSFVVRVGDSDSEQKCKIHSPDTDQLEFPSPEIRDNLELDE
jgi:hypothetical protein